MLGSTTAWGNHFLNFLNWFYMYNRSIEVDLFFVSFKSVNSFLGLEFLNFNWGGFLSQLSILNLAINICLTPPIAWEIAPETAWLIISAKFLASLPPVAPEAALPEVLLGPPEGPHPKWGFVSFGIPVDLLEFFEEHEQLPYLLHKE